MNSVHLQEIDFRILSSAGRRKILQLLRSRNYTLTEIAQSLDISLTSTKKHLAKLEETGYVTVTNDRHKWIYYTLAEKGEKILNEQTRIILFQ